MVMQVSTERTQALLQEIGPHLKSLKNLFFKNPNQSITEFVCSQSDSEEGDDGGAQGLLQVRYFLPAQKMLQNLIVHQDVIQGQSANLSSVIMINYTMSSTSTRVQGVRKLYIDINLQGMDLGRVDAAQKRKFKSMLPACTNAMTVKTKEKL